MKNLKLNYASACLILFILVSCSKDHTKQLARTWSVVNMETSTSLQDSVKAKMLQGSEMTFTKDGHYNTAGGIGADEGTYTLDKDEKNISTVSSAGKSSAVYAIENISDDELVLKNDGNTVTCKAKN